MVSEPVTERTIYHVAEPDEWSARNETHYAPSGYDQEGFIHCSSKAQLPGTLDKHYPGRTDLLILTIDSERVQADVIWEDLYGSGIAFPHIYGELDVVAVVGFKKL